MIVWQKFSYSRGNYANNDMRAWITVMAMVSIVAFSSCEKCYKCETNLGTETECCGTKADCETFRDNCRLTGGTNLQ